MERRRPRWPRRKPSPGSGCRPRRASAPCRNRSRSVGSRPCRGSRGDRDTDAVPKHDVPRKVEGAHRLPRERDVAPGHARLEPGRNWGRLDIAHCDRHACRRPARAIAVDRRDLVGMRAVGRRLAVGRRPRGHEVLLQDRYLAPAPRSSQAPASPGVAWSRTAERQVWLTRDWTLAGASRSGTQRPSQSASMRCARAGTRPSIPAKERPIRATSAGWGNAIVQ